jgi:sec-independent protein translocase protein TatB
LAVGGKPRFAHSRRSLPGTHRLMFDIGFSEMIVCAVVALVVIGPERLPRVARTLGVLFGRLQRYVTQVKADINREMDMADLGKVKTEFESAARSFQEDIKSQAADVEREVRDAQSAIENSPQSTSTAGAASPTADVALESSGAQAQSPPASPQLELGIEEPTTQPRKEG